MTHCAFRFSDKIHTNCNVAVDFVMMQKRKIKYGFIWTFLLLGFSDGILRTFIIPNPVFCNLTQAEMDNLGISLEISFSLIRHEKQTIFCRINHDTQKFKSVSLEEKKEDIGCEKRWGRSIKLFWFKIFFLPQESL